MQQTYQERNPFRVISKIGQAQDDVLSFPSANAALSYAKRMARNREWHLVRFENFTRGEYIEQLDLMSRFLETNKAKPTRQTHIGAAPHLYNLGQTAKELELIAVKGSVELAQSVELIRLATMCGKHCGLDRSHIEAVLDDVFGPSHTAPGKTVVAAEVTIPLQSSSASGPFEAIADHLATEDERKSTAVSSSSIRFNPFAKR